MYVCICNGITERAIRQAAADGVQSLAELTRRTGCAGNCGNCADLAERILREEQEDRCRRKFNLPLFAAA